MREIYLIIRKSKQFLPQPISILLLPFLAQESHDLIGATEEGVAVTPDGVGCVGVLNYFGIAVSLVSWVFGWGGL